mgnify:CR=1 FL=1
MSKDLYYKVDGNTRVQQVTVGQQRLLEALQRGASVYRPARRPWGQHHLVGAVKIKEKGMPLGRVQDIVPDTLISLGLLEVTATRAPGGFRLDYFIPQGLRIIGPYEKALED